MTDFRILGAGVAGLTVATELAERGASVELIDPQEMPGKQSCSWWAGGMLAPFCEFESAEEPVLRLGQLAKGWWSKYTEVFERGTLVVAPPRDLPDLKRFSRRTESFEWVQGDQIAELEPELAGFQSGLFFDKEAHLDSRNALHDLFLGLKSKGVRVVSQPAEGPIGQLIDCRGFAACDSLKDLRGVKGEMLIVRAPDVQISRPVRMLHPRIPLYVVPRGKDVFMIGATMIESADRRRITARSILELLTAAYTLNPAFGEAEILEIGVDVRPAFSDNLPKIRRMGSTIFANGLFRHGFLLSPAMAQGVAELALNNTETELVDASHLEWRTA